MRWNREALGRFIEVAQGKEPADLCLRHCRMVNVHSGEIQEAHVAVHEGRIVGWGDYQGKKEIDAEGFYLCPGFIDAHLHIESTLLNPPQFAAAVLPWGTTTVIADPHEIANVMGLDGIGYFLKSGENLPFDIFVNLPSCVPATHLETSGASLRAADLQTFLSHERVLGLAEMMNFPGVLNGDPEVMDKLVLFQGRSIDGHAPQLNGLRLNAYIGSGIASDHECTTLEEAKEKLAKGMRIMIREGSQSRDLAALIPLVNDHTWPRCMFVSDDRHPDDLLREGHMNAIVNGAMSLGQDPVRAIALATWTPANHFGLKDRGAIAPGFLADFSLSPTLSPWNPQRVFKKGKEVAREGRLVQSMDSWTLPAPPPPFMNVGAISQDIFQVHSEGEKVLVIGVQEGTLLTKKMILAPRVEGGKVLADPSRDMLKVAVINRYSPQKGPALGFVHGLGLKRGAMATTVAHDSHNLLVAGTSDAAMSAVARAVRDAGGGMAIGEEQGPLEILPLPVAGLMSDKTLPQVVASLEKLKALARSWGSPLHNPFMALSFLALPVIPELKLTDKGLVDVNTFSRVPLFQ